MAKRYINTVILFSEEYDTGVTDAGNVIDRGTLTKTLEHMEDHSVDVDFKVVTTHDSPTSSCNS